MGNPPDISIAQEHVFQLVVCAVNTMPKDEVIQRANALHHCGTRAGWCEDEKHTPGPCDQHPTTHSHYVLIA